MRSGSVIQFPQERAEIAATRAAAAEQGRLRTPGGDIRPGEPVQVVGIVPAIRESIFEKEVGHVDLCAVRARLSEQRLLLREVRAAYPPEAKPTPRS